jgi:hypothetical protein
MAYVYTVVALWNDDRKIGNDYDPVIYCKVFNFEQEADDHAYGLENDLEPVARVRSVSVRVAYVN